MHIWTKSLYIIISTFEINMNGCQIVNDKLRKVKNSFIKFIKLFKGLKVDQSSLIENSNNCYCHWHITILGFN